MITVLDISAVKQALLSRCNAAGTYHVRFETKSLGARLDKERRVHWVEQTRDVVFSPVPAVSFSIEVLRNILHQHNLIAISPKP